MRPNGLRLFGDQNEITSFDDEPIHQTWDDYDGALESLLKVIFHNYCTCGQKILTIHPRMSNHTLFLDLKIDKIRPRRPDTPQGSMSPSGYYWDIKRITLTWLACVSEELKFQFRTNKNYLNYLESIV